MEPDVAPVRDEPIGLYIHVPFCASICEYCNFNRSLLDEGLKRRYVRAVIREIESVPAPRSVDTIYFGGGTPSLLEPVDVAAIIEACARRFDVATSSEVTLEANPETVTEARLEGFRSAGINRLSFGVQSFKDDELRRLGRLHDAARARSAVQEARQARFDNISLDLMMWLPGQTMEDWRVSLASLVALSPEHASLYLLELYPSAPLSARMTREGWSQAPDDDAADMYLLAMEQLDRAGYRQYEISNVARPGFESRHNLKYWTDGEWVGIGCGAHSTLGHVRWNNRASTVDYVNRVEAGESPVAATRVLSPDDQVSEALFMELRLSEGVDLVRIERRYGVDVRTRWGAELARFEEAGLLVCDRERMRLTREGMLLSNEVMSAFL
jgi:oxygen-independent coproporphyrinogen III oxidase